MPSFDLPQNEQMLLIAMNKNEQLNSIRLPFSLMGARKGIFRNYIEQLKTKLVIQLSLRYESSNIQYVHSVHTVQTVSPIEFEIEKRMDCGNKHKKRTTLGHLTTFAQTS